MNVKKTKNAYYLFVIRPVLVHAEDEIEIAQLETWAVSGSVRNWLLIEGREKVCVDATAFNNIKRAIVINNTYFQLSW